MSFNVMLGQNKQKKEYQTNTTDAVCHETILTKYTDHHIDYGIDYQATNKMVQAVM
jgi:hypothetical protein